MDEMDAGRPFSRKRRWYSPAGNSWQVTLTARNSKYVQRDSQGRVTHVAELSADLIMEQAMMAFWWFCSLGGIGSKARKGFGSFGDPPEFRSWKNVGFDGSKWRAPGERFREACGVPRDAFEVNQVASPSLAQMRTLLHPLNMNPWMTFGTPWTDVWRVLDEIGTALQDFAQSGKESGHGKHCPAKSHLGLPRAIHRKPNQRELCGCRGNRHPSPAMFHVTRSGQVFYVRGCAFPTADTRSPDKDRSQGLSESELILGKLLYHVYTCLEARSQNDNP
jgi:CRISPR-associated protein Cmr6